MSFGDMEHPTGRFPRAPILRDTFRDYSMTPAGVSKPNTRAKCRYSSGPQVWRQTRQVQPISVMICSAGWRTSSPAESRRNADLAPQAGHGAESCLTLVGWSSDFTANAQDSTLPAICSTPRVFYGRHGLAASTRNRAGVVATGPSGCQIRVAFVDLDAQIERVGPDGWQ